MYNDSSYVWGCRGVRAVCSASGGIDSTRR